MVTLGYGAWKSPISAEAIVSETIRLGQVRIDAEKVFWIEGRPKEGGRQVVVRRNDDGTHEDFLPLPFNARTRVHEYGGGDYTVHRGLLYFSNYQDQRVYKLGSTGDPVALTENSDLWYADFEVDDPRNRLVCIREDHREKGVEAKSAIVSLSCTEKGDGKILVEGYDFYACPRVSPDGKQMVWFCWNHPNMPWDGTELWLADLDEEGKIISSRKIAGGLDESIFQPTWNSNSELFFASDRSGWWNLYQWKDSRSCCLLEMEAEFGMPHWQFGMGTYDFIDDKTIVTAYSVKGIWKLGCLDIATGKLTELQSEYTVIGTPHVHPKGIVLDVASPARCHSIVMKPDGSDNFAVLRKSTSLEIDEKYLSKPEAVSFPTGGGEVAYGFYYPPTNPNYEAPTGELPPLLVKSHGGPTAATGTALSPLIQFYTSRGFGVLDVNYRGSTGYGRAYMKRLEKSWGIVDVDDCTFGAKYLVDKGKADPKRLAIFGGSAGGYTTLAALAFRDVFAAGVSYFGVSDIESLAKDTHKFESRYAERLVGKYPEEKETYRARSPIYASDKLTCPVIFFQGLEDTIVPPNQAETMVAALKKKGIYTEYVAFEGERHGFRKAENIKTALTRELKFYGKVFQIEVQP